MGYKTIFKLGFEEVKKLDEAFTGIVIQPNLSIPKNQIEFKAVYQAFVEEVSELMQFIEENKKGKIYREGTLDEVADCFNFATLMFIRSGLTFNSIPAHYRWQRDKTQRFFYDDIRIGKTLFNCVTKFGMVCNLLKNRPWKQSNYPLDLIEFRQKALDAYITFLDCINSFSIEEGILEKAILNKINVNYNRMKQNY